MLVDVSLTVDVKQSVGVWTGMYVYIRYPGAVSYLFKAVIKMCYEPTPATSNEA